MQQETENISEDLEKSSGIVQLLRLGYLYLIVLRLKIELQKPTGT
jgi:hypothetical protein